MIEFGSIYYFMFIILSLAVTIATVFFLKNKSKRYVSNFILVILLSAFILHFLKLLFEPYYSGLPQTIRKSSFENICAVSTLVFPWFYLSNKKMLMDYMIVIGIFSGIAAMVIPTEALGKNVMTFDVWRFYYAHQVIFLAPFLMLYFKVYQFDYKRSFFVPFMFYTVLAIILTNEVILMAIGFVEGDFKSLIDPNNRNSSFIFGPTAFFAEASWILTLFVPEIFMRNPITGEPQYWPIIWLIIPSYIYISLFGLIIGSIFDRIRIKNDLCKVFRRRKNEGIYS